MKTLKKISDLIPDDKNFNKGTEYGEGLIKKSFEKFGAGRSILVDKNNKVIAGNKSLQKFVEQGGEDIEVIETTGNKLVVVKRTDIDLNTKQGREMALADNATSKANIEWDLPVMEMVCAEWDIPLTDWGIETQPEATEDDYEIPDEIKTSIVRGDIFELKSADGKLCHRVGCLDATSETDVKLLMGNEKADIIITDPPYGIFYDAFSGNIKRKYEKVIGDGEDFKPELITSIFKFFPSVKEICLFGANYFTELIPEINKGSWLVWDKRKESQADVFGAEFELIWSKQKHKQRMLRFDWLEKQSSVNPEEAKNRLHTTQKPSKLIGEIINEYSKAENLIVDLYLGSGTTLIAGHQLGRNVYGMEISPQYCQIIIDRILKLAPDLLVTKNGKPYTPKTI